MITTAGPALTVLVVDDDNAVRAYIASLLEAAGHAVLQAPNATVALALFTQHPPDLVLLDVAMPVHDGYWLAAQLRKMGGAHWMPIVFLSGRDQDEDLAKAIESGGDDYLVKPVSPLVLAAKLRAMQRLIAMQKQLLDATSQLSASNQHLQHLSEHDPLTTLLNRRGFDERLAVVLALARRNHTPVTLMLCDIDQFKNYNDRLGHAAGDECLRKVGELLRQLCRRPGDYATRYGGEEFALILSDTPQSGAMTLARAIQRVFNLTALPHPASSVAGHITLSGGVTTCVPDQDTTAEGMVMRADEALYVAKSKGRNRFFNFELQLVSQDSPGTGHGGAELAL